MLENSFLCGYFTSLVYSNIPKTLIDLKQILLVSLVKEKQIYMEQCSKMEFLQQSRSGRLHENFFKWKELVLTSKMKKKNCNDIFLILFSFQIVESSKFSFISKFFSNVALYRREHSKFHQNIFKRATYRLWKDFRRTDEQARDKCFENFRYKKRLAQLKPL